MKKVNVDIVQSMIFYYSWKCPYCLQSSHDMMFIADDTMSTLICSRCSEPIYRHAPGDYGTERPA